MNSQTRGLAVVENAIAIARSPGDVFDYCTDLTREPEWNPKAKRVEKITDGPIGVGTRFEAEFLQGSPMTIELVRFDRPVAWESLGRSRRLDAKGDWSWVASCTSRRSAIAPRSRRLWKRLSQAPLRAVPDRFEGKGGLDANDQPGRICVPGQQARRRHGRLERGEGPREQRRLPAPAPSC
jgi:hypothetical protein